MNQAQREFSQRMDRWTDAPSELLDMTCEALLPANWPKWLRRTYLLALPISLPIHGALWLALVVVFLTAFVLALAVYLPCMFWLGGKDV